MKKIIVLLFLLLSVIFVNVHALDSNVATSDCCQEIKIAAGTNTIPVYSNTDLKNSLYMGCPKCGSKYFFNMAPENGETLYICTRCRYQFIIRISLM